MFLNVTPSIYIVGHHIIAAYFMRKNRRTRTKEMVIILNAQYLRKKSRKNNVAHASVSLSLYFNGKQTMKQGLLFKQINFFRKIFLNKMNNSLLGPS